MARFPGATWRPLANNWDKQPRMVRFDLIILHTMVGSLWGTDGMFRADGYGGAESHFGIGHDGENLQWQDTAFRAEANGAANSRAISIETADYGPGFGKWDTRNAALVPPWTPGQLEAIAQTVAWAARTHGIPLVLVPDSGTQRRGVAYHRLGVPARRGDVRSQTGGELWSSAAGKACPGAKRIAQVPEIVSRARKINAPVPPGKDVPRPQFPSVPQEPEMDATERRLLNEVHRELTQRIANRVDYSWVGEPAPAVRPTETVLGFAALADSRAYEARQVAERARRAADSATALGRENAAKLDEILALLRVR